MLDARRRLCCGRTRPEDEEIRIGLVGEPCRCTGYDGIVKAVRQARRRRSAASRRAGPRGRHPAAPRRLTPALLAIEHLFG
jgi:carbon-monoxide dehydrogenase small subunit